MQFHIVQWSWTGNYKLPYMMKFCTTRHIPCNLEGHSIWCCTRLTHTALNFWKLTSYCSLKPLWSGMEEVVLGSYLADPTSPIPPTVHQLSWLALSELKLCGKHSNRRWRQAHYHNEHGTILTLTVLVATIDAQREGMRDVGSARYEPALLPPCPTIRVLSYSTCN